MRSSPTRIRTTSPRCPQSLGGSSAFNQSDAANLLTLFQQNNIPLNDSATVKTDPAPTVTAEADNVTGSLMWIVTSVLNGVTSRYYIRQIPADSTTGTAAHLEIDTELQTFNLTPQAFLLQISGQLTLQPPGQSKPFFSIRGAIQLEITDTQFEFFAFAKLDLSGSSIAKVALIAVNPALALVNYVDVTALFDIQFGTNTPGVAGYLKVDLSLGTGDLSSGLNGVSPNVNFTGSFQLLFNTTESQINYTIPNQFLALLDPTQPTTIVVPAAPPPDPLFTLNESNSTFPDASTLPATLGAGMVAIPSNWQAFFSQNAGITLSSAARVELTVIDAAQAAYSWTITDSGNTYTITKQYADPENSDTTNQLVVQQISTSGAVYIQLQIQGNLDLFNQITLVGTFQITASTTGAVTTLNVQGTVTANVSLLGTLAGAINFTAQISTDPTQATGFWGSVNLELASGGIIPGVTMSRSVLLLVNASNMTQQLSQFVETTPATTPPTFTQQTTAFAPGIELQIYGYIDVGTLLDLNGEFSFTLQLAGPNPGLTIMANAALSVGPIGSLSVAGVLAVNSSGLVADLTVSLNSTPTTGFGSGVGIGFTAMATLELNTGTTAQTFTFTNGQTVTVQPGFQISISGSIEFLNLATATGSALISITNQAS